MPEPIEVVFGSEEHIEKFADYWAERMEVFIRCHVLLAEKMGFENWRESAKMLNYMAQEATARDLAFVAQNLQIVKQSPDEDEPWKP